jgi:hypothetical protein
VLREYFERFSLDMINRPAQGEAAPRIDPMRPSSIERPARPIDLLDDPPTRS